MKKVIIVGKLNGPMQEIHTWLSSHFQVQLCSEKLSSLAGMIKIIQPDLIIISLIGVYDIDPALFRHVSVEYHEIPVLTIGTESEKNNFLKFYDDDQFENLVRPVEKQAVYEACCRRLGIKEEDLETEQVPSDGKKKVLVVDDNAGTLRSIMAMLKDRYDVMLATSGMKAMTSIGKCRPDLILLDYEMPVCDGKQTLEMIRAEEDLKSLPVIFLTSVNDRAHIEAVLALKPAGYLLKPAVKEKLIEAIDKSLRIEN